MKSSSAGAGAQPVNSPPSVVEVEKKSINEELWQVCAGPLVNLPAAGTHVVYFPQGHSEQVAASMKKDVDAQIPNYPNLPSKLLCLLLSVTLHADPETDEVYAQMTLQPVPSFDKDSLLRSDLATKSNKPQPEFFCKTLTASDTSTHGGFSVPRRAAEKIFPPLDFTMQPPAQELVARDLHDNMWTFRHIYRGQPKRHLLTTGWSLFVGGKRLLAGNSVLFIRDEKQQLLLGVRRANRQPTNLSSSVLSSDSMHIGVLAAAAHAAANNSPFTVFYNPRASPSEFVIPLAKYYKAVCSNQISLGMRFRMMFETEESGTRRYMGTITGISDLDPVGWKNSHWRNLQVGWDESTVGERRNRVSFWEIEPVTAPFFICPSTPFFGTKRPRKPGMQDDDVSDLDNIFRRTMPWLGDDFGIKDRHPQPLPGLSLVQWMNMQQNPSLPNSMQPTYNNPLASSVLHNYSGADVSSQLSSSGAPLQFNAGQIPTQPVQQLDQFQKMMSSTSNLVQSQQLCDFTRAPRQNLASTTLPANQVQSNPNVLLQQQQELLLNHQLQRSSTPQQQQMMNHSAQQNLMSSQPTDHTTQQQLHMSDNQIQQLLQKLHHQKQSLLAYPSVMQQPTLLTQLHDQSKHLLDTPPNTARPISVTQMVDSALATANILSHPNVITQQMPTNNSPTNLSQPQQQTKLSHLPQQCGMLSELHGQSGNTLNLMNIHLSAAASSSLLTGAGGGRQSAVADEVPSCSTSPSTNNCPSTVQSLVNGRNHPVINGDDIIQPSTLIHSNGLERMSSTGNLTKDLRQLADVKPSTSIPKGQNLGYFTSQPYLNATGTQIDYLDSSSSATSVLSHGDAQVLQNNSISVNSQSMLFRDVNQDVEFHGDVRNNISFEANIDNQFGIPMMHESLMARNVTGSSKDFTANESSGGGVLSSYENPKEARPELSSSIVSQTFGVPDMAFNSMDSTVNDGGFMNTGAWGHPQMPMKRTFTKVYKRGAVGRSIDISRYAGYDELKQDLARRFGIEGQLEDGQRVGWKFVYVDHENDVLLVGDDPWEEFVNCVRCIKILSPQEVQQMSLDGDFGNNVLPNQACSSPGNGVH